MEGPEVHREKLPSLESILATVPRRETDRAGVKSLAEEVVPEFVRVVRASKLAPKQMVVISFNYPGLEESKNASELELLLPSRLQR
jgi:hypothetical protein